MTARNPIHEPDGPMVLHVDMDAFFASVEQASDPRLKEKPVIVCGDPERRGTVAAASYEARAYGVRAGMPTSQARRLCPNAIDVEGDPAKYHSISLDLLELYKRITPEVEPFSIDEAFLDLEGTVHERGRSGAWAAARLLQRWIGEGFGLTATVGAGANKLIAKMASTCQKPNGLTLLDRDEFRERFWPLPVETLWGVGTQTARALAVMGAVTIGDLAHLPEGHLQRVFGVNGPRLKVAAWGEDTSPVVPYYESEPAKSMGHEFTLVADEEDEDVLEGLLVRLSDQVGRRLRRDGYRGRIVVLKLRYADFTTILRQRALAEYTDDERVIARIARFLFRTHRDRRGVRLLGVTMAALENIEELEFRSQSPLFESESRAQALRRGVDHLRDLFGERAVLPAAALR